MKRLLVALVAALALLVGCGDSPPEAGTVRDKSHHGAYTYLQLQPIYSTSCSGKPLICRTYQTGTVPIMIHVPESWRLYLVASKDDKGWRSVSVDTYDRYQVGDYYPGERD